MADPRLPLRVKRRPLPYHSLEAGHNRAMKHLNNLLNLGDALIKREIMNAEKDRDPNEQHLTGSMEKTVDQAVEAYRRREQFGGQIVPRLPLLALTNPAVDNRARLLKAVRPILMKGAEKVISIDQIWLDGADWKRTSNLLLGLEKPGQVGVEECNGSFVCRQGHEEVLAARLARVPAVKALVGQNLAVVSKEALQTEIVIQEMAGHTGQSSYVVLSAFEPIASLARKLKKNDFVSVILGVPTPEEKAATDAALLKESERARIWLSVYMKWKESGLDVWAATDRALADPRYKRAQSLAGSYQTVLNRVTEKWDEVRATAKKTTALAFQFAQTDGLSVSITDQWLGVLWEEVNKQNQKN